METHVNDPDGRHIELIHGFVVLFMVPYTVVVILHRQVWIPATVLIHGINGSAKRRKRDGDVHPVKKSSHYECYVL